MMFALSLLQVLVAIPSATAVKYISAQTSIPAVSPITETDVMVLNCPAITSIPTGSFSYLNFLTVFTASNTGIEEMPDWTGVEDTLKQLVIINSPAFTKAAPGRMAILKGLDMLQIKSTPIEHIPTTCPYDPAAFEVHTTGSPLKVCDCNNAWIKQAHKMGMITVIADQICDDGNSWLDMSTAQLLEVCNIQQGKGLATESSL